MWERGAGTGEGAAHLEEREETVQFLLLRATIETHAAGVQQHADKTDAEEVVRHVDGALLAGQRPALRCVRRP